jgi:ABC-2 type transport system permease protein
MLYLSHMNSKIRLLYRIKTASLKGTAVSEWKSNKLKLLAGGLTLAILIPGIFILFRFLFTYIYGLEETFTGFGDALARRLLAMTFMSLGVFIGISSFISGVSVVYRSWETSFFLTLPMKDRLTAFYRILESWFSAGWATFLLGIPIILGFSVSLQVSSVATIISLLLFPFLIAIWLSSGTVLLGAAIRLSRRSGRIWRSSVLLGLIVVAGIFLVLRNSSPEGIIAEDNSALDTVHRFVADLPVAGGELWPHSIFGNTIASIDKGNWQDAVRLIGMLLLQAAATCSLAFLIICPGFRRMYSSVLSTSHRRRTSRIFLRSGSRFGTMLQKDILLFFRDPVQWSQLLLLIGLFLVYAMNLNRFPMNIGHSFWRSIVVYLNFSFSCFVTATLLVRFTFPSVSLEGPGLSYILQLPRGRRLLIGSKWAESFLFITPFIVGVGIWSTLRIDAGWSLVGISTVSLTLMCIALVSINVGLGAVYPKFDRASAANIASGHGGIIAAFISMGYVLISVSLLGLTLRNSFSSSGIVHILTRPLFYTLTFLLVLTVSAAFIFVRAGYRSLEKRDF